MTYETVIGLEVHIQSKTKSKMFCGCSTDYFSKPPNSYTCPVCLGLPGAMPVPNKQAIHLCVKTALALNCKINKETKFDRKHYFYPDLPKGYQISQYDQPVGLAGYIEIKCEGTTKRIGITRVHQEEDTAKSTHTHGKTLLDFNKSGVPLIEIVSEPDMRSVEQVTEFAKTLKLIIEYIGVSDANMEKGQMRFEVNMSLRHAGEKKLPDYKVEIKNIGSISVLKKVILKEYSRQKDILLNGKTPIQETRGLVDMSGVTVSQRVKETEADYRYFPEPDIPLIVLDEKCINSIKQSMPELPQAKKERYIQTYQIDPGVVDILLSNHRRSQFFDTVIDGNCSKDEIIEIAKIIVGDYADLAKKHDIDKCKPEFIADLAKLILSKKISRLTAKDVLKSVFEKGWSPEKVVSQEKLEIVNDSEKLESIIEKVIKDNPKVVSDMSKNKNAVMFLVGQVMKATKGRADPQIVKSILNKRL